MGVDIHEQHMMSGKGDQQETDQADQQPAVVRLPWALRLRRGLAEVQWRDTLIVALLMALLWCVLFVSSGTLQILAGIVPVTAGLIMGRRAKAQLLLHGILLGLLGFVFGFVVVAIYVGLVQGGLLPLTEQAQTIISGLGGGGPAQLFLGYVSFSVFALIPFPAFGTVMAGRSEERNRAVRELRNARGGSLERPGSIRSADDISGLSLPQLGHYTNTVFKKQGFIFKDYRFTDKDKHLDMWMEHEGSTWWLRLTVADKVRPGTIESLVQEMRKQKLTRGVVITNTEFTPDALKAGKARQNIILIDAPTLFTMSEG